MDLVRFGVAMDQSLLGELDRIVGARGSTRSEILRDLVRAEVAKDKVQHGVDAVGTLTLVYDHHVRDLTEKLNELQHRMGDRVRATLHVHLTHHLCLEVIVMHGRSDELRRIANQILATRGVKQGGLEVIADVPAAPAAHGHRHATPARPRRAPRTRTRDS